MKKSANKKMTAQEITEKYCSKCNELHHCETRKFWENCPYAKMME